MSANNKDNMKNGDDVIVVAIKHLADEVAGMRYDLRKVIEIDVELRTSKETMVRAWGKIDAHEARLTALEVQQPLSRLSRIVVFAGVACVMTLLVTMAFQVITAKGSSTINIEAPHK